MFWCCVDENLPLAGILEGLLLVHSDAGIWGSEGQILLGSCAGWQIRNESRFFLCDFIGLTELHLASLWNCRTSSLTSSDFPVLSIFYHLPLVHNFPSAYTKAVVSLEKRSLAIFEERQWSELVFIFSSQRVLQWELIQLLLVFPTVIHSIIMHRSYHCQMCKIPEKQQRQWW